MNSIFKLIPVVALATTVLVTQALTVNAGGVLRLDEVAVGEIDPAKAADYADSILMFNLYDTLVLPKQGEPGHQPHLATEWEGSGTEYTFVLREDVKFLSGNPLTADDVVFSFDRMKTIAQGLSYLFANVEKAEAIDPHTVKFTLKLPYAPFISSLTRLPILDKQTVMNHLGDGDGEMKDWGVAWLAENSAGTGAYKIVAHNPQEATVMEKNPGYFLSVPEAAPDQVRLRYNGSPSTIRTMISNGEHDISSQWLPPEVIKALASEGFQLLTEKSGGGFYIKMNTSKAPLDNLECRLVLANSFDYETALKIVGITEDISQGSPSTGAIPVGMFGANPADNRLKRNMEAAKAHLAKCPTKPEDFNLELSWIAEVPIEERFALLMQANFFELGIKSTIRKMPWALFAEQVSNPETTPHISQLFISSVSGDPDTLLYPMYHSSHSGTWQSPEYLKDEMVDKYLAEGRTVSDEVDREAAYASLNNRLMEIAPTIYGYDRQSVFVASNRVRIPALTDPSKRFALSGMGFTFRLMDVAE